MLVPAGVHQLDKARAAFEESAGDKAVIGETAFGKCVGSIALNGRFGFAGEIDQFGHARLHAEGHFVLGDAGVDFWIAVFGEMRGVHGGDVIEHGAAGSGAYSLGIGEIGDEVAGIAEADSLVAAW